MKTIGSLMLSLIVCAILLAILAGTGVVTIAKPDRAVDLWEEAVSTGTALLTEAAASLSAASLVDEPEQKKQTSPSDALPVSFPPDDVSTELNKQDSLIPQRKAALDYLMTLSAASGNHAEQALARYLKEERACSAEDIDHLMRMSFWKGFVTLQKEWKRGQAEALVSAFGWEKKLKQAGFSAKGLHLLSSEITAAENQMRQLSEQLTSSAKTEPPS